MNRLIQNQLIGFCYFPCNGLLFGLLILKCCALFVGPKTRNATHEVLNSKIGRISRGRTFLRISPCSYILFISSDPFSRIFSPLPQFLIRFPLSFAKYIFGELLKVRIEKNSGGVGTDLCIFYIFEETSKAADMMLNVRGHQWKRLRQSTSPLMSQNSLAKQINMLEEMT